MLNPNDAYLVKGFLLGKDAPAAIIESIDALIAACGPTIKQSQLAPVHFAGVVYHPVDDVPEQRSTQEIYNEMASSEVGAPVKVRRKNNMSPENRAAQGERLRKMQADKKARKLAASSEDVPPEEPRRTYSAELPPNHYLDEEGRIGVDVQVRRRTDEEMKAIAAQNAKEHKGSMHRVPPIDVVNMLINGWNMLAIGKKYGCNDKSVVVFCTRHKITDRTPDGLKRKREQLTRKDTAADDLIDKHSGFAGKREDSKIHLSDLRDIEQQLITDSLDDIANRYSVTTSELQSFMNRHSEMRIQRIKPPSTTLKASHLRSSKMQSV